MIANLRQSPVLNFLVGGLDNPLKEILSIEISEDLNDGKEEAIYFIDMVEAMLDEMDEGEPLPMWADPSEPIKDSEGYPRLVFYEVPFGLKARPESLREFSRKWERVSIPGKLDLLKV